MTGTVLVNSDISVLFKKKSKEIEGSDVKGGVHRDFRGKKRILKCNIQPISLAFISYYICFSRRRGDKVPSL